MTMVRALAAVLGGNKEQVDWAAFSPGAWDTLVGVAQQHGVGPLLYRAWSTAGWPAKIPSHVQAALRAAHYLETAHVLRLYGELDRILQALAPVTPVLVLKGAALGTTLYPDPALRPMSDLDLVVPREQLPSALQALYGLGYTRSLGSSLSEEQNVDHHYALRGGPGQSVGVELHWSLVSGDADWRTPPADWLWRNAERWVPHHPRYQHLASKDGRIWQLAPAAQLVYLAAHLVMQHGGSSARLLWLYDIHLLAQATPAIDWAAVLQHAAALRWSRALQEALAQCQCLFGTPNLDDVLAALSGQRDAQAADFIARKVTAYSTLSHVWLRLGALSPAVRLQLAWRIVCPSRVYMRQRYQRWPERLWIATYLYRWCCIAVQVVAFVARRVWPSNLQEA